MSTATWSDEAIIAKIREIAKTTFGLDLPDGSGKELLPLLHGALPPIPVLVFSVYEVGPEDAKGVDAALVKSRTDNEQLLATIKRLTGAE